MTALLDQVKAGETILITDRGLPVAQIGPPTLADDEGRLSRLERAGIIRRGTGDVRRILEMPIVETIGISSVVDLVLDERRSGW